MAGMNLYTDRADYDIQSLEMLAVYIHDHKMFKNIAFSLHPQYDIEVDTNNGEIPLLKISKKEKFVDLFKDYGLNVKIICGENGVGKTTLLNLIRDVSPLSDKKFLFMDKNGTYISTSEIELKMSTGKIINLKEPKLAQDFMIKSVFNKPVRKEEQEEPLEMLYFIAENAPLFDGIIAESDNKTEKNEYHFLTHFSISEDGNTENKDKIQSILGNFPKEGNWIKIESFKEVKAALKQIDTNLPKISFCRKCGDNFVEYSDFSHGEKNLASLEYHAYNSMEHMRQENDGSSQIYWFLADEPEDALHPEWARRFISIYMNAFDAARSYFRKKHEKDSYFELYEKKAKAKFTILFATHSPFLLSDVTSDYIIYLKKDSNSGNTVVTKMPHETFAGNIGEMFSENFFMENTIGEFARSKIKKIITTIKEKGKDGLSDDDNLLIDSIGDDLLKRLIKEMIDMRETAISYEKNEPEAKE